MSKFNQVCCWQGTIVGDDDQDAFVDFFKEEFDVRIEYCTEFKTLAGDDGEGGRNDVLFKIHDDDVMKFVMPKMQIGARWWEDVIDNLENRDALGIIPEDVLENYPRG